MKVSAAVGLMFIPSGYTSFHVFLLDIHKLPYLRFANQGLKHLFGVLDSIRSSNLLGLDFIIELLSVTVGRVQVNVLFVSKYTFITITTN